MTNTEIETTANAFPEPARSLYLAMKKAEQDSIEASARAEALIDRADAGEDLDDEVYAANDAADAAETAYAVAARAFNEVALPLVAEGPNYGHI